MKLKHVRQPENSRLCGQCCVAMLCGIQLQDAILAFGHAHGTRTAEMRRALERYGMTVTGRRGGLRRIADGYLPVTALVKMLPPRGVRSRRSHWVVVHEGRVYDPGCEEGDVSNGRLSSYLEVVKEK